jgi:hypothetical protein
MPPPNASPVRKRTRKPNSKPAKRCKTTASQLVDVNAPQPGVFESQLRESQPEDAIVAPTAGGSEAAVATTIANNSDSDGGFDENLMDDFEGIDWRRLPLYCKPLATQTARKSWIYHHGYRVTSLAGGGKKVFFVCRFCHARRLPSPYAGIYETTKSTSSAASHLAEDRAGHRLTAPGKAAREAITASSWLRQAFKTDLGVTQKVANTAGGFSVQTFRLAAVTWLVENNHSLREFETPAFKKMIAAANPEAAVSLWSSHVSVARYVMRLYDYIKPTVVKQLSCSLSKIHISFDGWTTKGGKRGYLGLVAHFVSHEGALIDLPIALPQLMGAHTGENMAEIVLKVFEDFGILPSQVGYFTLDNASNNDTAIASIANKMGFVATERRLRCGPHTLNLVGQTLL